MIRRPTFQEFADRGEGSFPRNAWVQEPGLQLYVRRPVPGLHPGIDFELANLDAEEPGQGALTRFLDTFESRYRFRVELVHNERLAGYLKRRGYAVVNKPWEGPTSNMEKVSTEDAESVGGWSRPAIAPVRETR
jgi:hypothetical protein